jgi:hypothetical protein
MPAPHPVVRLAQVAVGLRALAAELEDIDGQPPPNILWWASEIDEVIAELRARRDLEEAITGDG